MGMTESYLTISFTGEALLKEKSSKFFAFATPVNNEEEVRTQIDNLKKEHHSARHWCYAYRLGESGDECRSNDDGEPNHSAGDPILRQIDSRNLTYILVVVVRYFGGIKLGVGGLIQAYGGAASLALDTCKIVEKEIQEELRIEFGYEDMSEVMRIIKKHDAQMLSHEFLDNCWMISRIKRKDFTAFREELALLHRVKLDPSDE